MDRIIIREESSVIRGIARGALKGNWVIVSAGVFLFNILISVIPEAFNQFVSLGVVSQYNEFTRQTVTVSYVASFYTLFFTGVFSVGLASFFISFLRSRDINVGYLFNGFEYYLKCLGLFIMISIFTFLWLLLLIVPGIIAGYRYSQAFFILADDPSKGIMQCIEESKYMMNGNKAKLFCLQISFIGWVLLAVAGIGVIDMIFSSITDNDVVIFIVTNCSMVLLSIVLAYMETATTIVYEMLSGHLKAKPAFDENDYNFTPNMSEEGNQQEEQ